MSKFVKIKETRFFKGSIKKYKPLNKKQIMLYFNTSRYKIECETIWFESEQKRNECINELDAHFLSD